MRRAEDAILGARLNAITARIGQTGGRALSSVLPTPDIPGLPGSLSPLRSASGRWKGPEVRLWAVTRIASLGSGRRFSACGGAAREDPGFAEEAQQRRLAFLDRP